MTHEELVESLRSLRLKGILDEYLNVARIAEKEQNSYEQYLFMLANIELERRHDAKIKKLIKDAKLPILKELGEYDYTKVKGVTAKQINRLAAGDFLREGQNIVFYGTFGVGKTHLAIGLIKRLCERHYRCLFTPTAALIEALLDAKKNLALGQLWRKLDRYDLIVCDELGYIPQTKEGADLFFQFISQRYERKSLLITTNLTYSEWDKVFLNEITTAAAVDRIIHKCETYNLQGPSWRRQEALKNKKIIDDKTKVA